MSYIKTYHSPIGEIVLKSDGENLTELKFLCEDDNIDLFSSKNSKLKVFDETEKWLDIYFQGKIPTFTPKYKIKNLTPFRKEVIEILNKIPYGKVCTYGEIASIIARKNGIKRMSAQAVGNAVGWNPICIIIPCHRVMGSNGNLTGYAYGVDKKLKLLKMEKVDTSTFHYPKIK